MSKLFYSYFYLCGVPWSVVASSDSELILSGRFFVHSAVNRWNYVTLDRQQCM